MIKHPTKQRPTLPAMPDARVVSIFFLHSLICLAVGNGIAVGFGSGKLLGILAAAVLLALVVLDRHFKWFPRVAIASATTYLTLVGCDVVFWRATLSKPRAQPLRGLHTRDDKIGYRLTPHARHIFDDGVVTANYEVNSLGHRDNEPSASDRRILLLGDSFTFGVLLDQSETIDKQVERITRGTVDAYNLGVTGYGPPAILETLRRCPDLNAGQVFYLFYWNDAMPPDLHAAGRFTVLDGYLVGALDIDGKALSQKDLQARLRRALKNKKEETDFKLTRTLRLHHLRAWMRRKLAVDALKSFRQEDIALAVDYTRRMQETAVRNGADFSVVIIPSVSEARRGCYSAITQEYCAQIRERKLNVIELLDRLSEADYLAHDGHFNPSGATQAATAIVEHLQQSGFIDFNDELRNSNHGTTSTDLHSNLR